MPDAPELNLDSILGKEKHSKLSQLDPDFYERASQLIKELEDEKRRAEPDSKYDDDITEQLEVAIEQVSDIIQIRMRKIVGIAQSQSVKKNKHVAPAMTYEEIKFYNALISLMTAWRQDCHGQFGKRRVKKETGVLHERKEPEITAVTAVGSSLLIAGSGFTKSPENKKDICKNYIVLRLLKNVPTFVGMDNRNYTLAKEDVVMVPTKNAKALITRKAAVQIGMK